LGPGPEAPAPGAPRYGAEHETDYLGRIAAAAGQRCATEERVPARATRATHDVDCSRRPSPSRTTQLRVPSSRHWHQLHRRLHNMKPLWSMRPQCAMAACQGTERAACDDSRRRPGRPRPTPAHQPTSADDPVAGRRPALTRLTVVDAKAAAVAECFTAALAAGLERERAAGRTEFVSWLWQPVYLPLKNKGVNRAGRGLASA
jgi:hypothetical protein